jgi:hypothetical protein
MRFPGPELLNQRMTCYMFPNGVSQSAGPQTVNDPHLAQAPQRSMVEKGLQQIQCFVDPQTDKLQLAFTILNCFHIPNTFNRFARFVRLFTERGEQIRQRHIQFDSAGPDPRLALLWNDLDHDTVMSQGADMYVVASLDVFQRGA